MKFKKEMLLLYAITASSSEEWQKLCKKIEDSLKGGVTMIQLREKNISEEEYIKKAIKIRELCHSYGVPLIINDNVEVAIKSGADGVHVGIEDEPVGKIRQRVGKDFIIGATAKTIEQARVAEEAGADYLGVGAVFLSSTKTNAIRITTSQLKEICSAVSIPAVAIGGISLQNVEEIKGGGMEGIAVVSAIFGAQDILMATRELKEKAKEVVKS